MKTGLRKIRQRAAGCEWWGSEWNDSFKYFEFVPMFKDKETAQEWQSQQFPKTKKGMINFIYKNVDDLITGFFSDEAWENVHDVWKRFDLMGLDYILVASLYGGEFPSIYKEWKFKINCNGKNIYGNLIAAGAGTIKDPLSRYDITLVLS